MRADSPDRTRAGTGAPTSVGLEHEPATASLRQAIEPTLGKADSPGLSKPAPPAPAPATRRRVFLLECHPVTREGFAQLIGREPDLEVCGQAGAAAAGLRAIAELKPELVVMDLLLPDTNGLELLKQLKKQRSNLPILVLSAHDETLYAQRALRAGAQGYVMKAAPVGEVLQAMRTVLGGELYASEAMRTRVFYEHLRARPRHRGSELAQLSDRELQIFELIGLGLSTRRIAARFHISTSTVESHRAHLKEKLGLASGLELVRRAVHWVNRPEVVAPAKPAAGSARPAPATR